MQDFIALAQVQYLMFNEGLKSKWRRPMFKCFNNYEKRSDDAHGLSK